MREHGKRSGLEFTPGAVSQMGKRLHQAWSTHVPALVGNPRLDAQVVTAGYDVDQMLNASRKGGASRCPEQRPDQQYYEDFLSKFGMDLLCNQMTRNNTFQC